jgi:flavin reductase (DIM6/NTAB) family NADH-FMN oxidoreductase RutF
MTNTFKPLNIKYLDRNLFSLLDDDWMLITGGNLGSFNTMTASWGGFGILWNKPVAFVFIRPQRYTLGFMEKHEYFTLSVFGEEYRDILNICGSVSGRDTDKIAETGLTPVETENKGVFFQQANLYMECRKLYRDRITPGNFIMQEVNRKHYKNNDHHYMFIAEITTCMSKQ